MCEVMEELMRDYSQDLITQEKEKNAIAVMSKKKFTLDEIADMFEMPLAKVQELGKLHHLI